MEADALKSQIEELREEIQQYERLTTGEQQAIHFESFQDLPQALVQARIAAGLTQKELAERLGLQEQQIQRYEATQYASASLSRLTDIMDSLGVNLAGDVTCVG